MNDGTQVVRWHVYGDAAALTVRAARIILRAAEEAIRAQGHFRMVLAGGTTPQAVYARLAHAAADWLRWHVYFGDERCLPPADAQRNSRLAARAWLDKVAIPRAQVHAIPAERGPQSAATAYREVIAAALPFDLVLLGLGADGHTASLFAGRTRDDPLVVAVHDAPKPPPERVSLSAHALSAARQVLFLVSGEEKRLALAAWLRGDMIPATAIVPAEGVDVLVDRAAWPAAAS